MPQGIRIVKEDAGMNTTDPRQITLDTRVVSGMKTLPTKFLQLKADNYTRNYTVPPGIVVAEMQVPHGLNFAPAWMASVYEVYANSKTSYQLPNIGLTPFARCFVESDATYITIKNLPTGSDIGGEKWIALTIFAEPLESAVA